MAIQSAELFESELYDETSITARVAKITDRDAALSEPRIEAATGSAPGEGGE